MQLNKEQIKQRKQTKERRVLGLLSSSYPHHNVSADMSSGLLQMKLCGNNDKDEDNSPKTLNDNNQLATSQKFRQQTPEEGRGITINKLRLKNLNN